MFLGGWWLSGTGGEGGRGGLNGGQEEGESENEW